MTEPRDDEYSADAPGVQATADARDAPRHRVRQLLSRTIGGAWADDIFSESAAAAFWQTLSLPPLLLGLFGVLGYVGDWFGPDTVTAVQHRIIDLTSGVFSRNAVDEIIAPTVAQVLTTAPGEVVSLGFLLSFWSGSSATAAFVDAITRAYGQYQLRNLVWQRVLAVLLYLVGLAIGIVFLPIVALSPDRLLPLLPDAWEPAAVFVSGWLYYPLIGLVLVLALTTLYKIALPLKPPWYRGLPGALLAAVVFLVGVTGLRVYLDWITGTGYTYGALAAPIAFLLGTFFIALAIVIGAHLNAAVQELWPASLRRRGRPVPAPGPERQAPADLADAIRHHPEAAAVVLERLEYVIARPVVTTAVATAGDRQLNRRPPDAPDGS
ncbi:YihY/virulence factor BrkB family protein [Pseudonocardia sp.]|uniref:YihY/virulence factor BrkB family protein n=1 Tax=Pseudonocardia sp. TaxID=60912 RepID=UPI0031FE35B5